MVIRNVVSAVRSVWRWIFPLRPERPLRRIQGWCEFIHVSSADRPTSCPHYCCRTCGAEWFDVSASHRKPGINPQAHQTTTGVFHCPSVEVIYWWRRVFGADASHPSVWLVSLSDFLQVVSLVDPSHSFSFHPPHASMSLVYILSEPDCCFVSRRPSSFRNLTPGGELFINQARSFRLSDINLREEEKSSRTLFTLLVASFLLFHPEDKWEKLLVVSSPLMCVCATP